MTDNHGTDVLPTLPATAAAGTRGRLIRPLLWLVLVLCLASDVVISSAHLGLHRGLLIDLPVGVLGVACIVGLVVHHYRSRQH
ncbi:MAG TPA: hypothetical protein VHW44_31005 [Pseudonocardiaceae bacterium]|jgi:hypothetical protein|nr:hypothetical protein [Pseudonocardiaceae bacterium]